MTTMKTVMSKAQQAVGIIIHLADRKLLIILYSLLLATLFAELWLPYLSLLLIQALGTYIPS